MATHWIRELTTASTGGSSGIPFAIKALGMFLRYVLGFTNPTQNLNKVGVGDQVSAPDGANKQTLTDAAGAFTAADVGRTITITNMVDPNNNGSFTVTDFYNTTQVGYVNAAGSAETSSFDWSISVTGQSYWTFEKNGTGGSINISGTDKNFRDTAASSFVVGDTGKWLLLQDNANPRNSGWYQVTYVSATTVTLDFRSGAAEYPTQNLADNLSWWLLADNYQVPTEAQLWWRLATPHANGWELEVEYDPSTVTYEGMRVRVATDANWGGSKILSQVITGSLDANTVWFYCASNSEGEFVHLTFHDSSANRYGGFLVSNLDVFDAGTRSAAESVALMGNVLTGANTWGGSTTYERADGEGKITRGYVWDETLTYSQQSCYMPELTFNASSQGFTQWTSRELNARRNKVDFMEQPVLVDPDNVVAPGLYEFAGKLKGLLMVAHVGSDARTAYNDVGTLDRFHVNDGLGMEWPGVTPQH